MRSEAKNDKNVLVKSIISIFTTFKATKKKTFLFSTN